MPLLKQLKEKINCLKNKADAQNLLETCEKGDFNLVFRKASIRSETLGIIKFLYLHKDHFNIDVNAGKRCPLELAIENDCEMTVLFLLKLKEVAVDDPMRDKINLKYPAFRTRHITQQYVSLGDKLIKLDPEVSHSTAEYTAKTERAVKETQIKLEEIVVQLNSITNPLERQKTYINCLMQIQVLADLIEHEIAILSQLYENFEETFSQYLPFSYAQEKILYGNEFAKSNLNSSMKNTCLHNRTKLEKTMATIQHNNACVVSHLEQAMSLFHSALSNHLSPSEKEGETSSEIILPLQTLSEEDNQPLSLQTKQQQETVIVPNLQEQQPSVSPSIQNDIRFFSKPAAEKTVVDKLVHEDLSAISTKQLYPAVESGSVQEINIEKPVTKVCNDVPNRRKTVSSSSTTTVTTNIRLNRLEDISGEIAHLKQKGQVKLSSFLNLIQDAAKEIRLELKSTKKGLLVNHSTTPFSFHTPHKKDKGVDKEAVKSLELLVSNEIKLIS